MITFTESAQDKIQQILQAKGQKGFAVRLRVIGRATDEFVYEFRSVEEATRRQDDTVIETESFKIFVDADSAPLLDGATIDFGGLGRGEFHINNPNPVWEDEISREVARIIHEQINPAVAMHSGAITLVDVKDNVAHIRMQGGCQGCGAAGITLTQGIERQIRQAVPQIEGVVDVTRHEEGSNPYYAPDEVGQSPVTG